MLSSLESIVRKLCAPVAPHAALAELYWWLNENDSLGAYREFEAALGSDRVRDLPLPAVRIAVLQSSTLQQMEPYLRIRCLALGVRADVRFGEYNQYAQEILDQSSWLYEWRPQVVFLAVHWEDMVPNLVSACLARTHEPSAITAEVLNTLESLVSALRSRSDAVIILQNFSVPAWPGAGISAAGGGGDEARLIRMLNDSLGSLCEKYSGLYVLDYDRLTARWGKASWLDPRFWYTARMRVNPRHLPRLADEYARFVFAACGLQRKCLVLDLDNTLWGGIVGEDGPEGIRLGDDYPGSAYRDFQSAILNLYHRGIILAVNSKNNPEDALEVLERHPHMILRPHHFASMRINWRDKASNIRDIANELNIGLDSLVFLDDDPVEVALMREQVPEVRSYQVPAEPWQLPSFIEELPDFEALTITEEDRQRGELYRQQVQRRQLEERSMNLEDFYRQLEMVATIEPVRPSWVPRVSQLTQRTNQFNLTTRRYTEADIQRMLQSDDTRVYALELVDRFGSNGVVGVAILKRRDAEIWIDTLLLSCRVMSRTVERTFLSYLSQQAIAWGGKKLVGEYLETRKNKVVADLYKRTGFECAACEDGRTVWVYDLAAGPLPPSPYVRLVSDATLEVGGQ